MNCNVADDNAVIETMEIPHPERALVYRPDGEAVWLRSSSEFEHKQAPGFYEPGTWVISSESKWIVWVNGKATVQPIIKGKDKHHLYIAENIETEPENTYFIECYFVIGGE